MSFHFASTEYTKCFQDLPVADVPQLRASAVDYLDNQFDPQEWQQNPIASLLNGQELRGGTTIDTINALGQVNGRQDYATVDQVQQLKDHIRTYRPPTADLRVPLRRVEQQLLTKYAGFLIGNQCLDFQKQDGVTEMEEATMANHVERKLNDLVWQDEQDGKIMVDRSPIYISCVSNFTNFLDLFRKTVRSLEVGIPCVVLGRSNTVQHSYRWTKLLVDLCVAEGVDPGMITYLSCPLEDIKDITQSLKEHTGNLYSTCSRELAEAIKSGYPNTVASTGGPNTLVAMDWTKNIQEAIRISATIESSGQCTALRHAVVPPTVQEEDVVAMLEASSEIGSAPSAMKESIFDGIFANHEGTPPVTEVDGSYKRHPNVDACFKLSNSLPPNNLNEHWRKIVMDVSKIDTEECIDGLVDWLNTNQPISMAVTGKTREQSLDVGLSLWQRTGLVVNTIGTPENPALTCQARPQEAEVFGEFPPRHLLDRYTKYPVVVPSSTPAYGSTYTNQYLREQADKTPTPGMASLFLGEIDDKRVRGYCVTLLEYLLDATAENPKRGFGTDRTALWGLQRPPLTTTTYLICDTQWDDIAPILLPFQLTNAKDQVVVATANDSIRSICEQLGVALASDQVTEGMLKPGDNIKVVDSPMVEFGMVGQFLSTLLPIGHIKSTVANDEEFVTRAKGLKKWLKMG